MATAKQDSPPATNGVVLRPLENPAHSNLQDPITDRRNEEPHHHDEQSASLGSAVLQIPLPTAPRLEEELAKSLANVLHMQQNDIDVEEHFLDMGLDSVSGVEWVHFINKQYAINLAVARIYEYPTINQMASFLEKDLLKYRADISQTST
jgi:polyketide synthase PksL